MEDFANLIAMDTKHRKAVCMGLNGKKGQIRLHIWWKWFWLHTGDNDYVKHTKPKVIHHRCFSTWKDVASLSWSKEVIQDGILNLCKVLMSTETVNKRTCKTLTRHNGTRSLQRCPLTSFSVNRLLQGLQPALKSSVFPQWDSFGENKTCVFQCVHWRQLLG